MNMEQEIQKILEESTTDITAMVRANVKERLADAVSYSLRENIGAMVKEFFETELKEDVATSLKAAKPELQDHLQKAIAKIAAEAGKQMTEQAAKNLSQSWNVKKLVEALFH